MQKKRIKDGVLFDILNISVLCAVFLIIMYPLVYIVSASLSNPMAIAAGQVRLLPRDFTLMAYERVFRNHNIMTGYRNTVVYTLLGTAISICLTTMIAYPMSKRDFLPRGLLTVMVTVTMFFSGGLIPTYLVVRSLGMLNRIWAVVLPGAVSAWNVIIMRTYFQTSIPVELIEAAELDGCTNVQTLTKIVLPLSKPIITVLVLFYGVGQWNSYFSAMIYLTDQSRFPLQLVLREILLMSQMAGMMDVGGETSIEQLLMSESLKYAVIVVASAPVLVIYPFLQKYFVRGIMVGALKG